MAETGNAGALEGTEMLKRAINLDNLKVAVDKIREDYPSRTEVAEQIQQAALGEGIVFATTQDVLALFQSGEPSTEE